MLSNRICLANYYQIWGINAPYLIITLFVENNYKYF